MPVLTRVATAARCAAIGTALIAGFFVSGQGVDAQDTNIRRILSPEETRQCLCWESEIEAVRAKLAESDPLEQEFRRVDELVAKSRPFIDTSDPAEIDSFRRLYGRREALRQQLLAQRGNITGELGGMVATYNAQCANSRMFKVNVDAVRSDPNACTNPQ